MIPALPRAKRNYGCHNEENDRVVAQKLATRVDSRSARGSD